jgi:hypothetical protein
MRLFSRYRARHHAIMLTDDDGLFWLTCPACGYPLGRHDRHDESGHEQSIPSGKLHSTVWIGLGAAICDQCTALGVGCKAWARKGRFHYGCRFLMNDVKGVTS